MTWIRRIRGRGARPGRLPIVVMRDALRVENGDDLVRRIEQAGRYFPIDNLALSPQCGFASTMEGNLLTEDQQWAKLRLVVETAKRVWR